jgi:hypothetical protein
MGPSKETLCEGHLPLIPATPVQVVTKVLHNLLIKDDLPETGLEDEEDGETESESECEHEGTNSKGKNVEVEGSGHEGEDDEGE